MILHPFGNQSFSHRVIQNIHNYLFNILFLSKKMVIETCLPQLPLYSKLPGYSCSSSLIFAHKFNNILLNSWSITRCRWFGIKQYANTGNSYDAASFLSCSMQAVVNSLFLKGGIVFQLLRRFVQIVIEDMTPSEAYISLSNRIFLWNLYMVCGG